jgi:hypothetical protein
MDFAFNSTVRDFHCFVFSCTFVSSFFICRFRPYFRLCQPPSVPARPLACVPLRPQSSQEPRDGRALRRGEQLPQSLPRAGQFLSQGRPHFRFDLRFRRE